MENVNDMKTPKEKNLDQKKNRSTTEISLRRGKERWGYWCCLDGSKLLFFNFYMDFSSIACLLAQKKENWIFPPFMKN